MQFKSLLTNLKPYLAMAKAAGHQFAQSGRMMVGVGDYHSYCIHMREKHPELTPLSEVAYFRRCQLARYPSQAGKITRCPC